MEDLAKYGIQKVSFHIYSTDNTPISRLWYNWHSWPISNMSYIWHFNYQTKGPLNRWLVMSCIPIPQPDRSAQVITICVQHEATRTHALTDRERERGRRIVKKTLSQDPSLPFLHSETCDTCVCLTVC